MLVTAAGCGEGEGVSKGATVSAYVAAPLCAEAERELAHERGQAGDVKVRAVCLPSVERHGQLDLATVGANARRATEDSASVAYIGTPDPIGVRFSEPILDEADIPRISTSSGAAAMAKLLRALRRADDSGSLREAVRDLLR